VTRDRGAAHDAGLAALYAGPAAVRL